MKNKDFSQSAAETIGEFVYKDFPEYQDKIFTELKSIVSLLYVLVVLVIIGLFV